jgi:hypothetical protein
MRAVLFPLFAALAGGCVLSHSIAMTPNTLPIPPDAVPAERVDAKGCTLFLFGFLPISSQSQDGLKPHSAYNLIQDASGGEPLAGVTVEEWQRLWIPIGLSHCTYVNGRVMTVPNASPGPTKKRARDEASKAQPEPDATDTP